MKCLPLLALVTFSQLQCPGPTPPPPPPPVAFPLVLGAWGGRPSLAVGPDSTVHVVADGVSSRLLAWWDITSNSVTGGTIDAATFNPHTLNLYDPSQVILSDGTQIVGAWWVALGDVQGCQPFILYRKGAGAWRGLACNPTPSIDWQPAAITPCGGSQAVFWGFGNNYYRVSMDGDTLVLGDFGSLPSPKGGGEKENRYSGAVWHVANAGCHSTGGAWYRNSEDCSGVMWGDYNAYPLMGSDDRGHVSVCGDMVNPAIGYMVASWNSGLVFNVWDAGRLLFPANALPVLDRGGWSGCVKYPMSLIPCSTGGAWLLWTNGGGLYLAKIHPDGKVDARQVADGTIGAVCEAGGWLWLVYNQAGNVVLDRIKL